MSRQTTDTVIGLMLLEEKKSSSHTAQCSDKDKIEKTEKISRGIKMRKIQIETSGSHGNNTITNNFYSPSRMRRDLENIRCEKET